jgi:hypothetical protein
MLGQRQAGDQVGLAAAGSAAIAGDVGLALRRFGLPADLRAPRASVCDGEANLAFISIVIFIDEWLPGIGPLPNGPIARHMLITAYCS